MKRNYKFILVSIIIYQLINISKCNNMKKGVENDNREDNGDNDENNTESMEIPQDSETNNITCTRRQNSLMHEIATAKHNQFPFVAAIMSKQNEYLCSGSVVSNGLILTTAECTLQPASYVLLNTTRGKNEHTAAVLHIIKSEKFPTFTGHGEGKNVGLIYTEKYNRSIASKVRLSNYTSLSGLTDIEGIGFGLNAEAGQTKELQYIGMESRMAYDTSDLINAYFDCVETKVTTCFKDTGGPVIVDNELVGIVTTGSTECTKEMSATYAINKQIAVALPTFTFKAWLDEKIKKNEEHEQTSLATYPSKPELRENTFKLTGNAGDKSEVVLIYYVVLVLFVLI